MTATTRDLDVARRLAREAGRLIMDVYATAFTVDDKGGGDPVTAADRVANAHIVQGLRDAFGDDGIVAEESELDPHARLQRRCWFVDPLDGTREFVRRNGEFAVHIGLAVDGEARAGVVYVPARDRLYAGLVGEGCELDQGGTTRILRAGGSGDPAEWRLVVSRSNKSRNTSLVADRLGVRHVREVGSVGVKAGLIAEGEADVYVHLSPHSSRWDACAPEAVARAAGARFSDLYGSPYRYDGSEIRNLRGILCATPAAFDRVLAVTHTLGPDLPPRPAP